MEDKELEMQLILDDLWVKLSVNSYYRPLTGEGCTGYRQWAQTPFKGFESVYLPVELLADKEYKKSLKDETKWKKLRCRHDFEFWAAYCVKIKDKLSHKEVPFELNRAQRGLLEELEHDRLAGRPIRLIILKSRQWGGSTLIQMYMAWIQLCHRKRCNSVICGQVKDTASTILGMYSDMLSSYPEELWEGGANKKPMFKPYERAKNIRTLPGRDCRVTITSSERPDNVRGGDYALAHLSETAFWKESAKHNPRDVIQAVCGSVALAPYTMVVIESTAKGVGDYFHREWLRSSREESDKKSVFVPWYASDYNRLPCPEGREFMRTLSDYEKYLVAMGCDSTQLWWYRQKSREFDSSDQLHNEFPSNDVEAFVSNDDNVFQNVHVEALRAGCREGVRGEMSGDGKRFVTDSRGNMTMWRDREPHMGYVVAVDVGGRSANSDWSVIAVLSNGDKPEVVAQWRGHMDHDILADIAVAISRYYNRALLVIESNTLESRGITDGSNLFVLNRMALSYGNLYRRRNYDTTLGTTTEHIGFHTNVSTKAMIINRLIAAVRDGSYVERDHCACDEFVTYRRLQNGGWGACSGKHDDILMTRAIALQVMSERHVPRVVSYSQKSMMSEPIV